MTGYLIRRSGHGYLQGEYVLAAWALGASNTRIVFKHILPTVAAIVTFIPFRISGGTV